MTRRLALLCLLGAAFATGCGVEDDAPPDRDVVVGNQGDRQVEPGETSAGPQPARPIRGEGVIAIDGDTQGSLTRGAVEAFTREAAGGNVQFRVGRSGEDQSFGAFCAGRLDILDTARPINTRERAACRAAGIDPVELQITSDGLIFVTRSEEDLGVDCLTLSRLRQLYSVGSEITQWSQLGGFRDGVVPAGADEASNSFGFFAFRVLGITIDASLEDVRGDFRAFPNDVATARFVVERPRGAVGFVRFSFYEEFEDRLRPLEIDAELVEGRQDCVFPSQETITTGRYPLSRRLLYYVDRRNARRSDMRAFLDYVLRNQLELAENRRFVPLTDPVRDAQLAKLRDG